MPEFSSSTDSRGNFQKAAPLSGSSPLEEERTEKIPGPLHSRLNHPVSSTIEDHDTDIRIKLGSSDLLSASALEILPREEASIPAESTTQNNPFIQPESLEASEQASSQTTTQIEDQESTQKSNAQKQKKRSRIPLIFLALLLSILCYGLIDFYFKPNQKKALNDEIKLKVFPVQESSDNLANKTAPSETTSPIEPNKDESKEEPKNLDPSSAQKSPDDQTVLTVDKNTVPALTEITPQMSPSTLPPENTQAPQIENTGTTSTPENKVTTDPLTTSSTPIAEPEKTDPLVTTSPAPIPEPEKIVVLAQFSTTPLSAQIYWEDQLLGTSPLFSNIPVSPDKAGIVRAKFELPTLPESRRFVEKTFPLNITAEQKQISLTLDAEIGIISLQSYPEEISVKISGLTTDNPEKFNLITDGIKPGSVITLPFGNYEIFYQDKDGKTVARDAATLSASSQIVTLIQTPETLKTYLAHLESTPAGATVKNGEKVLGTTPLDIRLPFGKTSLTFNSPDLKSQTITLDHNSTDPLTRNIDLTKVSEAEKWTKELQDIEKLIDSGKKQEALTKLIPHFSRSPSEARRLFKKISPQAGALLVKTTPKGAQLTVDKSQIAQTTPLILSELEGKEYAVRISKQGFVTEELTKKINVGEIIFLNVKLKPEGKK